MTNTPFISNIGSPALTDAPTASNFPHPGPSVFEANLDASLARGRTPSNDNPVSSPDPDSGNNLFSYSNFDAGNTPMPPSPKHIAMAYSQPASQNNGAPTGSERAEKPLNKTRAEPRTFSSALAPDPTGSASSTQPGWELSMPGVNPAKESTLASGWRKYKDDQLLRNPGGDYYSFDKKKVVEDPKERESFLTRMKKDLSDIFGNVKNFFGNLLMGSKIRYRDANNEIRETTQRGLVGSVVDFCKDMGSALTLGFWHPGSNREPQGFMEHLSYAGSRLQKAFLGDLAEGIPQSVNHMAKNLVLAGLNLVQVLPDATVGNLEEGRNLTTTIFDNGQVMVEYLTDVIPSGDAWFRVHASSFTEGNFPVLYNLKMPEHSDGDARWRYVRNTPFRKTIETIGTLLADAATIALTGQSIISTNQNGEKHRLLNGLIKQ